MARLCLGLSLGLSALVLLSWPLGLWRWLTFGEGYIPMAPSTALALLVLAAGALFQREAAGRGDGLTRALTLVAGLAGSGAALLAWVPHLLGTSTPLTRFEAWLVPVAERMGGFPVGRMSPFTAAAILCLGLAVVLAALRPVPSGSWSVVRALAILFALAQSLGVLLGYLLGRPFSYAGSTIPMSAAAALVVALLGLSLFLELRPGIRPREQKAGAAGQPESTGLHGLGATALMLVLAIALGGYLEFTRRKDSAHRAQERELSEVAALRADRIAHWYRELTVHDVEGILKLSDLPRFAGESLRGASAGKELQAWMGGLQSLHIYDSISFWAPNGARLFAVPPEDAPPEPFLEASVRRTAATGTVRVLDLWMPVGSSQACLGLLVPVPASGPGQPAPGVLLLRVAAAKALFPVVQRWPAGQPSSETLLLRAEGGQAVILNATRHAPESLLSLRLSFQDHPGLAAAFDGGSGPRILRTRDHRGQEVLAALHRVEGTPWVLMAKVDIAEVQTPVREEAIQMGMLAAALILAMLLGIRLLIHRERHKGAERELGLERQRQDQDRMFRVLFSQVAIGIAQADLATGRLLAANLHFCDLLGYTEAELIDLGLRGLDLPSDPEVAALERVLQQRMLQGELPQFSLERRFLRKDGVPLWGLVTLSPLWKPGESQRTSAVILQDITERKQAEEALRDSEARFRSLFERSLAVMLLVDPTGGAIVDANPAAEAFYGWPRASLLRMRVSDINLHPSERIAADFQAAQEQRRNHFEMRHRLEDGSVRDVEIFSAPVRMGEQELLYSIIHDITDRKRVEASLREGEERLRLALAAGRQGLFDLDLPSGAAVVSPEYATMLGYDPETFHESNAAWLERLHPADREPVEAAFRDYVAGRCAEYRVEFRQRTGTGDWKWILSQGRIVAWAADGSPMRMLGTHTDITERKEQELRLAQLNRLFEALSAINEAIVQAASPEALFAEVCRVLVARGSFALAWVGAADPSTHDIKPVSIAGDHQGYLDRVHISVLDIPEGRGPTGTTLRVGCTTVINDFQTDPLLLPWREAGARKGWRSSIAVPIRVAGSPAFVLTAYSMIPGFFGPQEVSLMEKAAEDLSYALDHFGAEAQRRSAEAALQEARRFAQATLDGLTAHLCVVDARGMVISINESWRAFGEANGGNPHACGLGANYLEVCDRAEGPGRDEARAFAEGLRSVLAGERETFSMEYPCNSERERRWFLARVSRFTGGGPVRAVVAHENITARVQVEEALRESERTFAGAFKHSPVWIAITSLDDGAYLDANEALLRETGFSREEVLGRTAQELGILVDPAQREEMVEEVRRFGFARAQEVPFRIKSGEVRQCLVSVSRISSGNRPSLLTTLQDITERKQAEAALRRQLDIFTLVQQATKDSIWVWDLETQQVERSAKVHGLFGYDPGEVASTVEWWNDRVHPEDLERYRTSFRQALGGGETVWSCEYRWRRAEGQYARVLDRGCIVRDAAGKVLSVVGAVMDLSDQVRAEEALAASEAKSAFLATMTHEIRTPMIGMLGMVEVLSHTPLNEEQRLALDTLEASSRTLLGLIGDILDFSKIEAGRLELEPRAVSFRSIARDAFESHESQGRHKGLGMACHLDPALTGFHLADPVRCREILDNFLSNALKFTEQGSVILRVDVLESNPSSQTLAFRVQDTGIGISQANQDRLFQPFVQAESSTSRRFGGSGLGLSICRGLAALMGGQIIMESAEGAGTTLSFIAAFPRTEPLDGLRPLEDTSKAAWVPRKPPVRALAEASDCLILLAEDHPTNRLVLMKQLSLAGYQADVAEDGLKALEAMAKTKYALLLTDIQMPRLDGYQLAREVRRLEAEAGRPRIPILALTANALRGELERCQAAGMDDCIIKPVDIPGLDAKLRAWLPRAAGAMGPVPTGAPPADAPGPGPGPVEPPVDFTVLADLSRGDRASSLEILKDFVDSTRVDIAGLRPLLERGDRAGMARQAHRVKGAGAMVGARPLAAAAADLEALARTAGGASMEDGVKAVEASFVLLASFMARETGAS
ncbi:MAG: PAS domain S-box protein [Holophagaceae bacterium]|nr:PAS domain S-box protein [Holophagaceae bacterium]